MSRHDGPHHTGGIERPAQQGSVKAREASTLGGNQGHNHPTPQQTNQTPQNTDNHYTSCPPSRHIAPYPVGVQQFHPPTPVSTIKHPPTFKTTHSQSPTAIHTDLLCTPCCCLGVTHGRAVGRATRESSPDEEKEMSCLDRRGEYP